MILRAADRGAAITRQLLRFARQPVGTKEAVELDANPPRGPAARAGHRDPTGHRHRDGHRPRTVAPGRRGGPPSGLPQPRDERAPGHDGGRAPDGAGAGGGRPALGGGGGRGGRHPPGAPRPHLRALLHDQGRGGGGLPAGLGPRPLRELQHRGGPRRRDQRPERGWGGAPSFASRCRGSREGRNDRRDPGPRRGRRRACASS